MMLIGQKLGGWSRLWLVATVVWAVLVSALSYTTAPVREDYTVLPEGSSVRTEADLTVGLSEQTEAPEWSKAPLVDDANVQTSVDEAGYRSAIRSEWVRWLQLVLIPPLVVAAAMFASRWIWRGFARQ